MNVFPTYVCNHGSSGNLEDISPNGGLTLRQLYIVAALQGYSTSKKPTKRIVENIFELVNLVIEREQMDE